MDGNNEWIEPGGTAMFKFGYVAWIGWICVSSTGCIFGSGHQPESADTGMVDAGTDMTEPVGDVGTDGPSPMRDMNDDPGSGDETDASDVAVADAADGGQADLPVGETCDDQNPPARCDANPNDFQWGPATVIHQLSLADAECCFDYDADPEPDNAFGAFYGNVGSLADANDRLEAHLSDGEFVGILELSGLDDLNEDDGLATHTYTGAWTAPPSLAGTDVEIHSSSLVTGTYPARSFEISEVGASKLTADDGQMLLALPFPMLSLSAVTVSLDRARLRATIDSSTSMLPQPGVSLAGGRIGGVIPLKSFYQGVNAVVGAECTCLESSDPLMDISTGECRAVDSTGCQNDCQNLEDFCGRQFSAFNVLADVDLDGDGSNDALSVGYEFASFPANITGVVQDP